MSKPIFIQHSRFGLVTYAVSDTHLIATVKEDDKLVDHCVELRTLDSQYEVVQKSAPLAVTVALVATLVFGAMAWKLIANESLDEGLRWILAYAPLLFAAASLWFGISIAPRWELVVFKNHWGQQAFVIVRERNQVADCMAFVDQLVARIELAQSELDDESRAGILRNLSLCAPPFIQANLGVRKWKLAIVLGSLAMLLPLVPGVNEYLDALTLPIVILLSIGTVVLAALSLSSKESGRWISLLAIVMALIPMFLYE